MLVVGMKLKLTSRVRTPCRLGIFSARNRPRKWFRMRQDETVCRSTKEVLGSHPMHALDSRYPSIVHSPNPLRLAVSSCLDLRRLDLFVHWRPETHPISCVEVGVQVSHVVWVIDCRCRLQLWRLRYEFSAKVGHFFASRVESELSRIYRRSYWPS